MSTPNRIRIASMLGAATLLSLGACDLTQTGENDPLGVDTETNSSWWRHRESPEASLLLSGIQGGGGSTIGPDGALYVTEGVTGQILRVDTDSGDSTVFASGLPVQLPAGRGFGGPVDVAFIDGTAYVLASLVGPILGGTDPAGIYRIDGPDTVTLVANLAQFNLANPPDTEFFLPIGVQYALEVYRGDLLVTDGHLNRVLRVTTDGDISIMQPFGNTVPTGMDVRLGTIFLAEAGPIPHLPEDGKVVAFNQWFPEPVEVASGARLVVDTEFGEGRNFFKLYALSQGFFPEGNPDGSPALPNTGSLVKANHRGELEVVYEPLNLPTSVEFIGDTAYVVSLVGEIWKIENI